MKTGPLLIGVIVILTLVCSPVAAISKSELITYYRTTPISPTYSENNSNPAQDTEADTPGYLPFPNDILPFPNWSYWLAPDSYKKSKADLISQLEGGGMVDRFIMKDADSGISSYSADLPSKKPNIYLYCD